MIKKSFYHVLVCLGLSSCGYDKDVCGDFSYRIIRSFDELAGDTPFRLRASKIGDINDIQDCYRDHPLYDEGDELFFLDARYNKGDIFYLFGLYGYTDTRIVVKLSKDGAIERSYVVDLRGIDPPRS